MTKKSDKQTDSKTERERIRLDPAKAIKLVIFALDQEIYGIEINQVMEINKTIEITPVPNAPDYILGLIDLKGEVVTVVDPEKKFGLKREEEKERKHIIICKSEKNRFGILVDEVVKILTIEKDSISKAPDLIKTKIKEEYLKGVGILNERVFVVLDAEKIISPEEIKGVESAKEAKSPAQNDKDSSKN